MDLKKIKKSFVLQQDASDCGVACLQSLTRLYDGDIALEKLREISGTTKQGTTLLGLYQGANKIGYDAAGNEADIEALIEHGEPLILHVLIDKRLQHYLVCYGFENDKFIIGDPAKGIVYYTKEELDDIWSSKKCLTLKPNASFQKTETTKRAKKAWIINLIKEDYGLLGISIFIGIAISVLGMIMALFSQKLIDDLLPSRDLQKLFLSIALVAFLLLVRVGFIALRQFILITQSKQFNNRIIDSFYSALLFLPKSFFDTRKIGELIARLNDTSRIQRVITQIAGNFIIDVLISITSIAFLFFYSWKVALIALLSLPVYFFLIYRFNNRIISSQKEVMGAYAYNESNYVNTMTGISAIKNFNRQAHYSTMNKTIYGYFQDKVFDLGKINIRLGFLSGIAGVLFLMLILAYTSYLVYSDLMLLGELMAVIGISSSLIPSVGNLALIAIPINEAKVAFNRMFEFTNISSETKGIIKGDMIEFESLEIQNLSFRFSGRSRILDNINIKLKKGELIAIIGESGCGKSTLAYLLQKFYTAETGDIIINGNKTLEEINTNSWRKIIGVVPQDIHIFNGNVIDNICLGNVEEEAESVLKFLVDNGFNKFIDALPQSYLTLLGEEGINLSGGQKQIIAFARALYRKPQILILDEATSAMDKETEEFITNILMKLKKEIAVFYISHRFHTLKNLSDKIYIIKDKSIQTSGTHFKLLKGKNLYSEFWNDLLNN
ncbi:MAG: peptidase domain-containing ABC transporter [Bacteroidales bacterium]|nr:peptidase domain-containing ABC transporter [Bacteroidales bacterium]